MKIAHIINPVKVDKSRDLYFQQPIVFRSMEIAQNFCYVNDIPDFDVSLFFTCYDEDTDFFDEHSGLGWIFTKLLDRDSLYLNYKPERKIPFFKEIMDNLYAETDDSYDILIQTNADIILQPHFYLLVATFAEEFDAFCINKRIVPEQKNLMNVDAYPVLCSTMGSPHAGHDCFIFKRSLYPEFDLGDIIMGTPWSEGTMIANMAYHAPKFYVFKHAVATFHIGDRRIWLPHTYDQYRFHNCNETARIILKYANSRNGDKFLKHETIQYLIGKLRNEINGYGKENYTDACFELLSKV